MNKLQIQEKINAYNNRLHPKRNYWHTFFQFSGYVLWGCVVAKIIWAIANYDYCPLFYGFTCLP